MNTEAVNQHLAGLDEDGLRAAEETIRKAREQRGVDLEEIKPGMPADRVAAARAEINKILAGR